MTIGSLGQINRSQSLGEQRRARASTNENFENSASVAQDLNNGAAAVTATVSRATNRFRPESSISRKKAFRARARTRAGETHS